MDMILTWMTGLPVLNLSFFGPTQTTLLNEPGNDLSPENKIFYSKHLIDNAQPFLAYDQFGVKYPIPKGGGKTIEMRRFSPLKKALKPLTEGVTPVGNKLNVTSLTAKVEQYGDYIEHSDVLDMTAIDPIIVTSLDLLSSQAGRTLDTITREAEELCKSAVTPAPTSTPTTGLVAVAIILRKASHSRRGRMASVMVSMPTNRMPRPMVI